jgi:hypothetical protein
MESKNLLDRQAHWVAYLIWFNFVIKHIPGKNNPADSASLRPDFLPAGEEADSKRLMFEDSPLGMQLAEGQSLDTGQDLEIGEVFMLDGTPPLHLLDTGFLFLSPISGTEITSVQSL